MNHLLIALAALSLTACTHPRWQKSELSEAEVAGNGCDGKPTKLVGANAEGRVIDGTRAYTVQISRRSYGMFEAPEGDYTLSLTVENRAEKPIEIDWDKSSLTLAGKSHRLYLEDTPRIEKDRPQPMRVVPPNGSVTTYFYPADMIWRNPLDPSTWQYGWLELDKQPGAKASLFVATGSAKGKNLEFEICKH